MTFKNFMPIISSEKIKQTPKRKYIDGCYITEEYTLKHDGSKEIIEYDKEEK